MRHPTPFQLSCDKCIHRERCRDNPIRSCPNASTRTPATAPTVTKVAPRQGARLIGNRKGQCRGNPHPNPAKRRHDLGQLFGFIIAFKSEHDGNSPTMREIMRGCAIPSTSVCSYNLELLEASGRIRLCREGVHASRIEVVGGVWTLQPGSVKR